MCVQQLHHKFSLWSSLTLTIALLFALSFIYKHCVHRQISGFLASLFGYGVKYQSLVSWNVLFPDFSLKNTKSWGCCLCFSPCRVFCSVKLDVSSQIEHQQDAPWSWLWKDSEFFFLRYSGTAWLCQWSSRPWNHIKYVKWNSKSTMREDHIKITVFFVLCLKSN